MMRKHLIGRRAYSDTIRTNKMGSKNRGVEYDSKGATKKRSAEKNQVDVEHSDCELSTGSNSSDDSFST